MKLLVAKNSGFCFGVQKAVDIALKNAGENTYTYGEIIHNEHVVSKLREKGVVTVHSVDEVPCGKVIIRSHGAPESVCKKLTDKGIEVIDATCPFVKKIHEIVRQKSSEGALVLIVGQASHPEVIGIRGWCDQSVVIGEEDDLSDFVMNEKVCIVSQTTYNPEKFANIIKKICKLPFKTVEIFDTICYTTVRRQSEAYKMASMCDVMLVVGSLTSANTGKLFQLCQTACQRCYHVQGVGDLQNNFFRPTDTVGIVAGASTPTELIMEVKEFMSQQFDEVQSQEFKDAVEESLINYKEGKRVKGTVIAADEKGIHLNIGGKKDGLIPADEVSMNSEYNPTDYVEGAQVEAIITNKQDAESGCVLLSKKRVDEIKEGDKIVDTIRDGEVFELVVDKATKGGLLSKLGTYTVFIPASQIREGFVKDLKVFVGKTLRLTALEIEEEDNKHKIVASARKVFEKERKEREEIFWANVQPNVIVNGKVKRVTNFGAFVAVDGFDCLAHIADLSWNHIKKVEDVLTINESYDFLVLSVDREKGKVSLGYKQLQPHPFVACLEKHPVGSICKGKVISIMPYGAFVEIESGVEGLVHVSEAAHSYIKNMSEVVKVGDEVDVMILGADESVHKITLSIKACTPEEERPADEVRYDSQRSEENKAAPRKPRSNKTFEEESDKGWNEDVANNPFADLLKDLGETEN